MAKTTTRKHAVWDADYTPYGTYEGAPGDPDQWREAFHFVFDKDTAKVALGIDTPWAVLGVDPGASLAAIKKAFRLMALRHHPDKGGDVDTFRKVYAAYYTLTGV